MQFQPGRITSSRFDALTKLRPIACRGAVMISTVIHNTSTIYFKKTANFHFRSHYIAQCVKIIKK